MKSIIFLVLAILSLCFILPVEDYFGIAYTFIPFTLLFIFFYLSLTTNN